MRYLGLDLGTKSCGIAISDKTNILSTPKDPIFYEREEYEKLHEKLLPIIKENNIRSRYKLFFSGTYSFKFMA